MKRKILFLCLLCLLLAGCGKQEKAGLCLAQPDSPMAWMEDALQKAGYSVAVANAGLDQAVQNRQVQELLAEEYDILILEPVMAAEAPALAEACKAANVPVLFTGKEPKDALSWKSAAYIGLSAAQAGQAQGQLAAQLPGVDLNGDGVICYAILAGPETDMDAIALTENCQKTLPGECLGVYPGGWTREAGEKNGSRLLSVWGKDVEVVLCNSEALALGAAEAIKAGGRTVGTDIFLVSTGQGQQGKLLVKSGDFSGTAAPDMEGLKAQLLDTVKALLTDGSVEKQQYGSYVPITAENVAGYLD